MAEEQMQNLSFSPEDLAGQERKAKRQDQAAAFASWLNSMSIRPDPNLPAQLQAARGERVEDLRKNRTVNMLEQAGQTELANLVKAGTLDAKSAASQMFQRAAEERQFARQKELAALKSTDSTKMREYALAVQQGFKGSFVDYQQLDSRSPQLGTIPVGYELEESVNDEGKKVFRYRAIEGGPAALEAEKKEIAEKAKLTEADQSELTFNATGNRLINEIGKEDALIPATGLIGNIVANTPLGQRQVNVQEDLAVLEAQMQFGALAALKAASPSGASGLGQLTEAERKALGKTKFNFSAMQGPEVVQRNIRAAMLVRSYFKNGLMDKKTGKLRNATPEEFKKMLNGENPFTQESSGELLGDVQNYMSSLFPSKNIEVINGVTIEELP
jgi:hypothetical protein